MVVGAMAVALELTVDRFVCSDRQLVGDGVPTVVDSRRGGTGTIPSWPEVWCGRLGSFCIVWTLCTTVEVPEWLSSRRANPLPCRHSIILNVNDSAF